MGSFSCTDRFCKGRQVGNQRGNFWQFQTVKRWAGDAMSEMCDNSHVGSVMGVSVDQACFWGDRFLHFQTVNICPSTQEISCFTGATKHSGKIAVPLTQVYFGTVDKGLRVLYITSLCNFLPFYCLNIEVVTKRSEMITEKPSSESSITMKGNNQQSWHRDMKQSSLEINCVKQSWVLSWSEWVLFPGMDFTWGHGCIQKTRGKIWSE